jgi:hypothetical protein
MGDSSPAAVPSARTGVISIGCRVEVDLAGQTGAYERLSFDIVPDTKADFAQGFLGADTPMAKAILGRRAGSTVPYRVGDIREVRIRSVRPSTRTPEGEVADRQAILQKAISKSELAEAERFSLTVDLKWGGTDPQGIENHWE